MKKLIILLLLITSALNAATYYVSPTGSDGAAGTIGAPWATFQKAFNTAVAGDLVYFRGGVYYTTVSQNCGSSGTEANPIRFFNYPGEVPIVDGINKTVPSVGITFDQASWIHMKGITVRYHLQIEANDRGAFGFYLYDCSNMRIENCVAHNIGFRGFMIYSPQDSIKIINCDAYNVADSLSVGDAGNNGDGFIVYDATPVASDIYDYVLLRGCRAWHCSDDGYDLSSEGLVEIDSCWAIDCGAYPEYDYGNGFKLGLSAEIEWASVARKMQNCVAVYNGGSGVTSNDNDRVAKWMNIYNNTFAYNENIATFYNTSSSEANELKRIMRNNVSFGNTGGVFEYGSYTHDHNSWDIPITVTSTDFLSIDSTGIRGARQANGSLPVLNYLKLASTSDLINVGTDVDLPYIGAAPDLGYTEYDDTDTTALIVFTTSAYPSISYALIGVNVFDDGGDSVTKRGVCWSTSPNPTITNDTTINGSGTGTFIARIEPLLTNTTYYVSGYAINQWGIGYGNDLQFTTLTTTDKVAVYSGGKQVYDKITGKHLYINAGTLPQTILVSGITVSGTGGATTISTNDGTLQMIATVLPADATDKTVTWSRTNGSGSATISSSGLLTALTDGTVTVRATANDDSGVYDDQIITISNQTIVTSIDIWGTGGATTITVNDGTLQMLKKTLPITASDTTVTWSRTNGTGTASINSTGLLTALTDGTVTVRATANDGSGVYGEEVITMSNQSAPTQIIADHTIVDRFDDIPAAYITEVKKMFVTFPGESHSQAHRTGLTLLEASYPAYAVSVVESGTPEAYTTSNLRFSRATWGDIDHATGWIYDYGEEDIWTTATALSRTKAGIAYCYNNSLTLAAWGFAHCSDPNIEIQDYIDAMQEFIDYNTANGIPTKMIFTTGTVDDWEPEVYGYYKSLRNIAIRDYVDADATRILFDYADILCYDDNGLQNTAVYDGNTFPIITDTNLGDASIGHIGSAGAIRLAKAMWWMLARIAGWDGN